MIGQHLLLTNQMLILGTFRSYHALTVSSNTRQLVDFMYPRFNLLRDIQLRCLLGGGWYGYMQLQGSLQTLLSAKRIFPGPLHFQLTKIKKRLSLTDYQSKILNWSYWKESSLLTLKVSFCFVKQHNSKSIRSLSLKKKKSSNLCVFVSATNIIMEVLTNVIII